MDIPILFENDEYVAINKPAGLVVHPDGKNSGSTLVDWILEKYPEAKDVGEPLVLSSGEMVKRPGIVHRLDKDTSGVLIIAKTPEAFTFLKHKFKEREIRKTYVAFVYGEMKDSRGVIDRPIGRSSKDFRRWSASRGARGEMRDAVTRYRVIHTTGKGQAGCSFLELQPQTGRTHQIRVHLKAINHAVVGDLLYAPEKAPILGFKRLALHARSLVFTDHSGKEISIEAPYPADFSSAIAEIKTL